MNLSPITAITQFAPDADPTSPGIFLEVSNIIPSDRGWRSAFGLGDTGVESLTATCNGAALAMLMDGSSVLIAGTDTGLFKRAANSWTTVTGSETYAATADARWRFAMMGDNIIAATANNTLQVSNGGATFTTIADSPKCALVESVYGFIMAADTNETTYGDQSDRWWCSALFDHTSWTPSLATQATTGRLVDTPGPIRGLRRLGSNVVAYKDTSCYLGQYVEPPTVWDWTLISSNVGCASHDAVVNIGTAHVFPGFDNFYLYDGASVIPIGEPVRRWFFSEEIYRSFDVRIQAAHDPARALVYWFYPRAADAAATLTRAVVYQYRLGRWGWAEYSIEAAVDYIASGITYDGLGDYYATWDGGIDRTYDSPLWMPDLIVPSVFTTGHKLKTIDHASNASSFTTWEMGDDQRFSLLRRARIRWLTAPTTATMQLSTVDRLGEPFCLCGDPVPQTDNKFDKLRSARWHKLAFALTGDHELSGLQVDIQPQGEW